MSSEPGYSRQSSIRFMFRVAAVGVLLLAATAGAAARAWTGGVAASVGLWLAGAGFGGAAARYAAGEGAPVARDSLDYLTRTHRDTEPTGGPYCRACGTRNDAAASFCDSCGKSLA